MIKTILHFFKIHRKVILGNPAIVVEDMLGVAPKSLNPVDMILAMIRKCFAVVQPVMLAQTLQGVVASKRVGVVDRSFPRMLPDMRHQLISRNPLNHFCVHPAIALQKAEYNGFACRTPSALTLAPAAKVGLVYLDLALELARFQFRYMVDRLAQVVVDARNHLIVQTKVACHAIRGLLLVEAGKDGYLLTQSFQGLLFSTALPAALDIPAFGLYDPKRTAEYALSPSQKVGRIVKNILLTSNHKGILHPCGYELH